MEKTLQQQYVLIKEGKGDKDHFLKSARRVFPDLIAPLTDYTITTGRNAMSAGPITVNPGVTLTVPSGSTYTIV